jgi:hypothetical protein
MAAGEGTGSNVSNSPSRLENYRRCNKLVEMVARRIGRSMLETVTDEQQKT